MVLGFGKPRHREVDAAQLRTMLEAGAVLVVDVREENEFAAGHIPGAINMPLSAFDPQNLPEAGDRTLVLNCQGGKRSATALDKARAANAPVDTHLAGGFGAWQAAGFPIAH